MGHFSLAPKHFAKPLQKGTRIKLVVQAQSQPDNIDSPNPHRILRATGSSGCKGDHDRDIGSYINRNVIFEARNLIVI